MTKAKKCGGSKTAPLDDIPEWELGAWARLRHDSVETGDCIPVRSQGGSRRDKSTNRRRPQIELPLRCRCGGTASPYLYEDGKTSCKCLGCRHLEVACRTTATLRLSAASSLVCGPFFVSPLPRPPVSLAIIMIMMMMMMMGKVTPQRMQAMAC